MTTFVHILSCVMGVQNQRKIMTFFPMFDPIVDPSSMANVQTESSVLAANHSRDKWGAQPEISRRSQEEEAQITQTDLNHTWLPVSTSSVWNLLICFWNGSISHIVNLRYCLFYKFDLFFFPFFPTHFFNIVTAGYWLYQCTHLNFIQKQIENIF